MASSTGSRTSSTPLPIRTPTARPAGSSPPRLAERLGAPGELDLLLERALSPDPARRPASAEVMADELDRIAAAMRHPDPGGGAGGPGGPDYCDADVLRRLRRRSLAALRAEVEPVTPADLARFLPVWQGVGAGTRGADAVYRVVEQLAGVLVPASALESLVLPARVAGYTPPLLDELTGRLREG